MQDLRQLLAGLLVLFSWCGLSPTLAGGPVGGTWNDTCDDASQWIVSTADGVTARVATEARAGGGSCLRLDYRFDRGSGFCVVRRPVNLTLPANYRVRFDVRGEGPTQNLELKLLDKSGDSVWWANRREFEWPEQWQTINTKKRQFEFAWGPSAGAPLKEISAIEFAVASVSGGEGSVWVDNVLLQEIPEPRAAGSALFRGTSSARSHTMAAIELPSSGLMAWRSAAGDEAPSFSLNFGDTRELGGLAIQWAADSNVRDYAVDVSNDGQAWENVTQVWGSDGGSDYVPIPDGEARLVGVRALAARGSHPVMSIRGVRVLPPEAGNSPNALMAEVARDSAPGMYPPYFLGKAVPWTVVGAIGDSSEALIDARGSVEVHKRGFRLEPMLLADGHLVLCETGEIIRSLENGYMPIPTVAWKVGDVGLEITPIAAGNAGESRLLVRYRLRSLDSEETHKVALCVLVRPFQVLPPWQQLNITGGVSKVRSLAWSDKKIVVNNERTITPWIAPSSVGVTTFDGGEVVEHLARGEVPTSQIVNDERGLASGVMRFDVVLPAGGVTELVLETPLSDAGMPPLSEPERDFQGLYNQTFQQWASALNRIGGTLPPSASELVNTWRSQLAYILVNADGPAIQPGSRTYERSWIRDGALTCTALLQMGYPELVREYLDWYAPNQFDNGKIPCVVDRRGPDPVDEHDSTGQFLYILRKYHTHTRDRAMLERHWLRVVKSVEYLQTLRARRTTSEFESGPPEKRVLYGLVPESISHEGYSAKPMHSYWDDFFVLRGLKDAARIAATLGHDKEAGEWTKLADDFRVTFYASIRQAMQMKGIDYIPGCAELGDFDATSTTIGIEPTGELGRMPEPALHDTFKRYLQFFRDRRDGKLEWRDYTPYELRQIGTFVYLDQPEAAQELIDWFMKDRTPVEWNQWAEVVHKDKEAPRFIGDMPHTWVGSGFVVAVRSMFVYERESDGAMVLGAGLKPEWLDDAKGVAIADWPTEYGKLSYIVMHRDGKTAFEIAGDFEMPPGGLVLKSPRGEITKATLDGIPIRFAPGSREIPIKQPVKKVEFEISERR